MVEKYRRAVKTNAPNTDLAFPKSSLEISPVTLIRGFNVGSRLEKPLENEILNQVGCGELRAAAH